MILFCIFPFFVAFLHGSIVAGLGFRSFPPRAKTGTMPPIKRTVVPYYTIPGAIPREVIESYDLVVETI